ncbi:MAG: DNA polymerase I [Clostridiales bacterium]|nr:DNA polymerase I [Clostridiales bacterium]
MEKLVLIDGNSLINRAFYAMPLLTTKDGTPTNAVYGFMNMFFKMLSDVKPTYVAVAFDLKAPTFRHKLFKDYKGTRKPMPEELRPQIPLLKEVLRLMNIAVIEKEGSEADDIIGTIAKHTSIQTYIYTGDKDSFQLVDDETTVYFTKRGITDIDVYSIQNFTEKTGLTPKQIIDLKSLMGDSSDNIPGVSGVGEKTALNLVTTYGDLDGVYNNLADFKGKLLERLVADKEIAYLSKTLATIDLDCGVDTDVSKMKISFPFSGEVRKRFVDLEFKSLSQRAELFEDLGEMPIEKKPDDKTVKTVVVDDLSVLNSLAFSGTISLFMDINGAEIYDGKETEYSIKIRQNLLDDGLPCSEALNGVVRALKGVEKVILFNKKELRRFLYNNVGIDFNPVCDDVSLIKYLADYSGRDEKFSEVLLEYDMQDMPIAYALYSLRDTLHQKLIDEEMETLYKEIELPLSDVLFDMENSGFRIDEVALNTASKKYAEILSEQERVIRELTAEPNLNVNSPKQLGDVLFEKLKIGKGKKTKNGYSTTAEILESFEDVHPVISHILRYRQIQKLQSTYIEGFKPVIERETGLIHTSFNQTVTATGRLSSKEPNLQNIPVRDSEGREIRKFFVAKSDDRILIGADYSQIELRLLADFSNCKGLIDAFNEGRDVHAETASKVFRVPLEDVTPEMRRSAKAVNFGIIYGISEYGLAKNIKVSNAQAREYIKAYFEQYPEVKSYMDGCIESAKETGYAKTIFGRRRYIRELKSQNFNLRQFGERVAMNMPLQGSSADIIKKAMIGVANRLKAEKLRSELILQVHDELIIDAFTDEKEQVEKLLVEEMENAVSLKVKLTASVGAGKNWFDAK